MDEYRPLQQRAYPAGCDGGQDRLQEELGQADSTLAQGGTGTAAQLPQGDGWGSVVVRLGGVCRGERSSPPEDNRGGWGMGGVMVMPVVTRIMEGEGAGRVEPADCGGQEVALGTAPVDNT